MSKYKQIGNYIFYSFPIQLFLVHIRSNFILLCLWLLLFSVVGGGFGRSMGLNFLFLDAEYMGEVSFWSFYWIGLSFGVFLIAWNTTTYILNSYRFPFLATLGHPFGKYSLNNFIIPVSFIAYYMLQMIFFQWYNEFATGNSLFIYLLGFWAGVGTTIGMAVLYFQKTNKDILWYGKIRDLKFSKAITRLVGKRQVKILDDARKNPYSQAVRVDIFLSEWLRPRLVRSVQHYRFELLERVFRQNHTNALVIQSLSIIGLVLMSALVEYEYFRIPAAASTLILFSVITTLMGALTYWLQEWRTMFIVAMLALVNSLLGYGWFYYENKAYGLDYTKKADYTYTNLEKIVSPANYLRDMESTEAILSNWRKKFTYNPPLVVICVSGGGLRAALWGMQVLREADRTLDGNLLKHTVLMTGASGGMLGAAYYRELYHQKVQGKRIDLTDESYIKNISKDLANPLTFTLLVNDIFIPWVKKTINGYTYRQDRGYIFEQQLIENTGGLLGKNIGDYRKPEASGLIPMMFVTPVIINDGRFLVISPHKVSYMMKAPFTLEGGDGSFAEIDGADFGALFAQNDPYNLRFATALRMSATYPYILPNVYMPTDPSVEVIDAGFRDNYGTEVATRFLAVFREWIRNQTREVIIIQIRGANKITEVPKGRTRSIGSYFTIFNSIMDVDNLQDFHHDSYVGFLKSKLGYNKVHLLRFIYKPTLLEERASLSFHLTQREKNDVLNAIYLEENQKTLKRLRQLMRPSRPNTPSPVIKDSVQTAPTDTTDLYIPVPASLDTVPLPKGE
jgi:Patatin-like phospholipase